MHNELKLKISDTIKGYYVLEKFLIRNYSLDDQRKARI